MLGNLERVRDYAVYLGQESIGIGTFTRWQIALEAKGDDPFLRDSISTAIGLISLATPFSMRGITEGNSELTGTLMGTAGIIVDAALIGIVGNISNSLPEFLIYKGLVNLGSHAMADVIRFGIDHIRNFRPPTASTLAV